MPEDREDAGAPDRRAREEAEAAAREAGAIGGRGTPEADEAERPVAEGGGGVAEGFEQAEENLIEHASHGDPAPDPAAEAFDPEAEAETVERASRDHEHSTQRRDERQTG